MATITAEVRMGNYSTHVHGETIEEVLKEIKSYHTMTNFEKDLYTKKGTLDEELKTGWYLTDEQA